MTKRLLPLLLLAALVAGCGSDEAQEAGPVPGAPAASETVPTETAAPTTPGTTTDETSTGSTGTTPDEPIPVNCESQTGGEEGIYTNLVDVRVGSHSDGFDRVVFEFEAPDAKARGETGIPHYVIKAAKPPFSEDPSDSPIDVDGNAFARIVLQGASGYDFDGNATYDGTRRLMPGYETLVDVVQGGDFEATMTWIFGLSQRSCWQIQELHNPDRLVIDFHHVDV